MTIEQLPDALVNQIAAGEVVERPASIVKELIENALDAGATRVHVEIEHGGVRRVRVRDNGVGIVRDELGLALTRHATSKIRSSDDLMRVASMGFRGEALPSMASVSRLRLTSRARGSGSAWTVECELDGAPSVPKPAAHDEGTTVEVADLFFNVPARRKFLRAERTEFDHVQQVVRRLALVRWDVAFDLVHNRKPVQRWSAVPDGLAAVRMREVLGQAFADNAFHVSHDLDGTRLSGWIAQPTFSRSQADMQYFYVNGRLVRDRLVSAAVKRAYSDVLYHGRHPAYALFLELESERVDVNVHPAKSEVRFRDARRVFDAIHRGLAHALSALRPNDGDVLEAPASPAAVLSASASGAAEVSTRASAAAVATPVQSSFGLSAVSTGRTAVGDQRAVYASLLRASEADGGHSADALPPLGLALAQIHGQWCYAVAM
ncbi:MAG: DNA mismatch repair endonuclease MutL [Pseudomonadota bacterium]